MSEQFPECNMTLEMIQFPNQPLKMINRAFDKLSLLFWTVLEQEPSSVSPTVTLDFSWTLGMSDLQNDRFTRPFTLWRVPWVPPVLAKNSITEFFLEMNKFWNKALKKRSLSFKKISRHSVTASWWEAISFSPTVQLDFAVGLSKCRID